MGLNSSEKNPYKQLTLEKRLELIILNIVHINKYKLEERCLGFICCTNDEVILK